MEAVPCANWELCGLTGAAEGFSRASLKGTSKNSAVSSPPGVKSLAVTDLAGQSRQAKSDFSRCLKELVAKIEMLVASYNKNTAPFVWTATADSIFEKIQRLCLCISGAAHWSAVRSSVSSRKHMIQIADESMIELSICRSEIYEQSWGVKRARKRSVEPRSQLRRQTNRSESTKVRIRLNHDQAGGALDNPVGSGRCPLQNWELRALTGAAEGFSRASLVETSRTVITMAFFVMNTQKIPRLLHLLFAFWFSVYFAIIRLCATWCRPALLGPFQQASLV